MTMGDCMIIYNDILGKLKEAGYSQHRLRKENLIAPGTVTRLHRGLSVSTDTIGTVCKLLECQPGELLRWEQDDE